MSPEKHKIAFALVVLVLTAVFLAAMAAAQPPFGDGQFMERLRSADTNRDGSISSEEAETAGLPDRMVQALDTNRDGTITRNELDTLRRNREREQNSREPQDRPGISAGLAKALAGADTDKNGFVSRDEYKKAAPEAPQSLYDRLDANKDGKLHRDEIARVSRVPKQDSRQDGREDGRQEPQSQLRNLITSFKKIDADKNGELNTAELNAADINLRADGFRKLDTDKNAAISRNELRNAIELIGRATRDQQRSRAPQNGQWLLQTDLDKDGKITKQEFQKAAPNVPPEIFDRFDINKDGAITKNELNKNQQKFRERQNRPGGPETSRRPTQPTGPRRRPQNQNRPTPQTRNRPTRKK